MYAILRADLNMPAGKAASQAGHAFLDAYSKANPEIREAYRADGEGTKVVLIARNEGVLQAAYARAQDLGLPAAIVVESGHILPPVFDGSPIVTALGIGPVSHAKAKQITKRFRLM